VSISQTEILADEPENAAEKQLRILEELLESVGRTLRRDMYRLPEDWDGNEIRQWVADRFAASAGSMQGSRLATFRNDCWVNSL
jgi:hypothetical protein